MTENTIVTASAVVLQYDPASGQWRELGSESGICELSILKSPNNEYRYVAYKLSNSEVVLNAYIPPDMKYNETTPSFHQWYDKSKNAFGLNFVDTEMAKKYGAAIAIVLKHLNTLNKSPKISTSYQGIMELQKITKPFDGSGDVGAWISKFRLSAKLLGVKDLSTTLPMLLEGPAFSVYSRMNETKKTCDKEIEKALLDAFNASVFEAYDRFRTKSWAGESADVFLADLSSLAVQAGCISDNLLKCAFVVGMPDDISSQLRATVRISDMSIPEIVAQSRALLSSRVEKVALSAVKYGYR